MTISMILTLKKDKGLANGFSIKSSDFVKCSKLTLQLAHTGTSSARHTKFCIKKALFAT